MSERYETDGEPSGIRLTGHECAACGDRLYDVHLVGPNGVRVCDPECAEKYDGERGMGTQISV